LIEEIPLGKKSTVSEKYHKQVVSLSKQYFHVKEGSVYLAVVKNGEEYDIDSGDDPSLGDGGKANDSEMRAYALQKPTYTAIPISDDSGTYLAAFTPIFNKGRVVGLVAAEYDSAPLADLQGIAQRVFWSIVPAILVALVVSYVFASMFPEPIDIVRDIEDVKKQSLGTLDQGPPWSLTDRENDVFETLGDDLTNDQIAARLSMSVNTVKTHMKEILRKSGLKRWQLIVAARERRAQAGAAAMGYG
jgi:DNA-binding CsgD family transcriptional regulator